LLLCSSYLPLGVPNWVVILPASAHTFFWLDSWLPDGRLKDLAPHLFALISKRLSRVRFVRDALDGGWLDDIPPDLNALAVQKLLAVADHMEGLTVTEGVGDEFRWDGVLMGSTPRSPAILACSEEVWPWRECSKSGSPVLWPRVGFFSSLCYVTGAGLRTD
jgi:hypothetical protein